jgi:DNA-binding response OmpR family regulator
MTNDDASTGKAGSPHIVIVDDDDDARSLVDRVLRLHGYRVTAASNGQEGLDLLTTAAPPPDLILLDLHTPVMDGLSFLTAKAELDAARDVPVIVTSAIHDIAGQLEGLAVAAYCQKPLRTTRLMFVIEEVLRGRSP